MENMEDKSFQESFTESELARRVRWLMWRDNLNQKQCAMKVGIQSVTLSNLINKDIKPSMGTLELIAKAFGVTTPWLLGAGEITDGYAANNN